MYGHPYRHRECALHAQISLERAPPGRTEYAAIQQKLAMTMTTELEATFVFNESSHDSFVATAAVAARATRTARAYADNGTTRQVLLHSYVIGEGEVSLSLSDGRRLRIYRVEGIVEWELAADSAPLPARAAYADGVLLKLPDGSTLQWCPEATLQARLNKAGFSVAPTETTVSLDVQGTETLTFVPMVTRDGRALLFFEPE